MDFGLAGKVAIVTGGSQGIGRACATELAREGVKVAICARGMEALQAAAKEIQSATSSEVLPVKADMTSYDDIKNFVRTAAEHFGRVDILVNNAVNFPVGNLAQLSDEAWAHHINIKVMGYVRCMREVIPYMQRQGGGRIINIAGIAARQSSGTGSTAGATNAAIVNITKHVADQVARDDILVNAIHPGPTRTQRHQLNIRHRSQAEGITLDEAEKRTVAAIPIGRMVEPEEIAYLAVYLCSDLGRSITGQVVAVDGGQARGVYY